MNTSAQLVQDEEQEFTVSPKADFRLGLLLIAVSAAVVYGGLAMLFG